MMDSKIMDFSYILLLMIMTSLCLASSKKIQVKVPLLSIKSPDGDIIDCMHIYDQSAFDHPLLKNHTILKPVYYPKKGSETFDFNNQDNIITQLWQLSGRSCPDETIPIRRDQNAKDLKKYAKKNQFFSQLDDPSLHEHAYAATLADEGIKYHGGKATINVWRPRVQDPDEFSLSQIWIINGDFNSSSFTNLNSIEAGWMVYPNMYKDNNTRLFIFWTRDGYQTGCYNLYCPGFVQTSKTIAIGAAFHGTSTYHGPQFEISLCIWKDKKQGVWWLQIEKDNIISTVGYWPAILFTNLANGASLIQWGGEVINLKGNGEHTTTQMGSGHFPREGYKGASYFKNLQVLDESSTWTNPATLVAGTETSNCYKILPGKSADEWGHHFYYGGPGRNLDCP